jgi:ATP-binding cassette subfamily B protein
MNYPHYQQRDAIDCGPSCLKMIATFYGQNYDIDFLRENCYLNRDGVNLLSVGRTAERIGFKTLSLKLGYRQLLEDTPLPCILHWNQDHFVVLYKIDKKGFGKKNLSFLVADPVAKSAIAIDQETFIKAWAHESSDRGIVLVLEPGLNFRAHRDGIQKKSKGFGILLPYVKPYKSYILQLLFSVIFGALISLLLPFLTQALVDYGVQGSNISFITLILLAQLAIFAGDTAIQVIRHWLLLHMNTRISIHIISDFLVKLMRLPVSFFDSRSMGDLAQRIQDHKRIEHFLTGSSLTTLFSLINLCMFSVILAFYNSTLFLLFFFGSSLSVIWVLFFLKRRRSIDYKRFQRMRENQDNLYEIINGMTEIKLNGAELVKRWEWERIQAKLFRVSTKGLALEQYQELGSNFINQSKNILITYIAAREVVGGQITLGMLLSISYIIGQMSNPLQQLIQFFKDSQDARLSIERLAEIHEKPNEENDYPAHSEIQHIIVSQAKVTNSTAVSATANSLEGSLLLNGISFQYEGPGSPFVLKNINLHIPEGKVTAIVGSSGSGKTTLLKLLLRIYEPTEGEILLGNTEFKHISTVSWRRECGAVMQDSYVFNDTITKNISFDLANLNSERLLNAVDMANLKEYIDELPLQFATKLGANGLGMSGGQRQRLLIARAIYKDPAYLFLDEATSSLDANNERKILNNLDIYFKKKTVVIIAHRLSTVKNADQIIVLNKGEIMEIGTHDQLTEKRGYYYQLVKNQLELGN